MYHSTVSKMMGDSLLLRHRNKSGDGCSEINGLCHLLVPVGAASQLGAGVVTDSSVRCGKRRNLAVNNGSAACYFMSLSAN